MRVDSISLDSLKKLILEELNLINYPPENWVLPTSEAAHDVAIIGAGMAGLAAAFELKRLGITNIQIFDKQPPGLEGPWITYARMKFLRSTKEISGPARFFPLLTFQAWYRALFGRNAWKSLYKINNADWMNYLNWYRTVLALPVQNERWLTDIKLQANLLLLKFSDGQEILVRKVVLATGRDGFGGSYLPSFISSIPKSFYAHTSELIDFSKLKGKKVGVIGVGASGFDAAAEALENGATQVDILTRRSAIPNINKAAFLSYPGCSEGYYFLSDDARRQMAQYVFSLGAPPPFESLVRIQDYPNVKVHTSCPVVNVALNQEEIVLTTPKGTFSFDYLVLATGFAIDGSMQSELQSFYKDIKVWGDLPDALHEPAYAKINNYPYLGPSFEFQEKIPGQAPTLKNLHCFNYAATLSHWLLSSDIPEISFGSYRLARGIAKDLFGEDWKNHFENLKQYNKLEFNP